MNPKISIIIPIYNVEKYLKNCLDSVINQTLKDIQIILINDASPDNSYNIAKDYADNYSNITLINKSSNSGLANTRNLGLKYVKGEYITFLDSDDMLTNKACEIMYNKAKENNADIIIGKSVWYYNENKIKNVSYLEKWYRKKGNLRRNYELPIAFPIATSKLFKTSLILENNLKFHPITGEDVVFSIETWYKCKNIYVNNNIIYLRTERQDDSNLSITQTFSPKIINDRLTLINIVDKYCKDNDIEFIGEYCKLNTIKYILHGINNIKDSKTREESIKLGNKLFSENLNDINYINNNFNILRNKEKSIVKIKMTKKIYMKLESFYRTSVFITNKIIRRKGFGINEK